MRSNTSLKGYLSRHFGAVAILPVIIIAGLVWFFMMPSIQRRAGIQHQALARSIAGQISIYLMGGERQLIALAGYLQNRQFQSDSEVISLLDAQCGKGEFFETLFIVDNAKVTIQSVGLPQSRRSNRADFMGLDLSGQPFVLAMKKNGREVWSQTFLSTVSNRLAVARMVPLKDCFIIGEITLEKLSEYISRLAVESGFLTLVVDGQGMIVADSQNLYMGELLRVAFPDAAGPAGQIPAAARAFEWDGESMLGALVEMDASGWKVLVAQPSRKAFQPLRDTLGLIGLGLAIALVLVVSASRFLAVRLAALVTTYTERAESIADGHYVLQWPVFRTKEFKRLGKSLERMAEKISQREKALVDSEARLINLTANVPGVVIQFRTTRDHIYTNEFLNAKITDFFGLEQSSETVLDEFYAHIPDEEKEAYISSMRKAIDSVSPWTYEGRFNRPDGKTIWFSGHAVPYVEGDTIVYYGILMDITQRKEIETSLRLAQFIIDSANVGISRISSDNRILDVNPKAAELLGYTREELKTLSICDIDILVTPETWRLAWRELVDNKVFFYERKYRRKDGAVIPVEIYSNLLEYEGRQYAVAFIQDITERKQMEEMLKGNEERLKDLVSNVPGVVYQHKMVPGSLSSSKWTSVIREKVIEMFGLDSEMENFFNEFVACLPENDRNRFSTSAREAIEAEEPWHYEGQFTRPSGEILWFEGNSVPRRVGDELLYYGVLTDITQRKEMETSLRFAQYIIEKADIGIFILGENGEFLDFNEEVCCYLGYSRDELIEMDVFDVDTLFTPEGWAAHMTDLRSHGVKTIETLNRHKNGTVFPVQVIDNIMTFEDREFHVAFVQDITERKQAEKALRENEQRLVNILESMNEGVIVLDSEFRYQIFNTAIENITNTPKQEVLGKRPWDIFAFIKGSVIEDNVRKAMSGKTQEEIEIQLPIPHKYDSWFRESYTPLRDTDGQIVGVIQVVADITSQKQNEEELHSLIHQLKESEARFKALHDASFGGITIHEKGLIIECNQGLSEITGYSVDELIGMNGLLLIAEKSREMVLDKIVSGYEKPYEAFGLRKNGEEFPIRLAARNIPYKGKQVRAVEFRDITEQKQAEAELRHLKNYLSNIIDSMPSVLVGVDRDNNVTQWNSQAQQTTGLSLEEVRARPLEEVFPRLADEMNHIKSSIGQRRVIRNPKIKRREEKDIRFEDVTIFPLVANGVEGAVIRVDDVTEQVRLEEMMVQGEKMLSVGGLAAGMAHEINNPLAGMMQTAEVMANRLGGKLKIPASLKAAESAGTTIEAIEEFMEARGIPRMLNAITDSGKRVAAIVNNMLSFARKSEATVSSQGLEELLDKTAELAATDYDLKKQYDFKKIEIQREYAGNLPEVPCERAKIQQVLLNILRNGAQAMQAAGVESPRFIFRTGFDDKRNMAVMEIKDNGPGMNEETRKRVFEPFFTTKPEGVGTGLGLSVSYFIITENHGGEMEVNSRPGAGASFIIRLPAGGKAG